MSEQRKVRDLGAWWRRQSPVARIGVVVAIVAAVGLAVGLGGRTKAQTPAEKTFLADLNGIQADAPEADRVQLGKDICHMLRAGESPGAASRYFGTTDRLALAVQLSGSLSAATAPGSLCPDQAAVVERWSGQ